MPEPLDVYRDWLGVKVETRPLNHYQLLRLPDFEDDLAKIRSRYTKLNAHVRKFAGGDYARQSQDLLNELSQAMLCLTDRRRKSEYDASLGRKDTAEAGLVSLEQILLRRKVIDTEQLKKARSYAEAVGLDVRDALVQQKMADTEVVWQAFAESQGLPYIDPAEVQVDGKLIVRLPAVFCRKHSIVPLLQDDEYVLVASPKLLSPDVEDEVRLRLEARARTVLCTPANVSELIGRHYSRETAEAELLTGRAMSKAGGKPGKVKVQKLSKGGAGDGPSAEERQKTRMAASFAAGIMTLLFSQLLFGVSLLLAIPLALAVGGLVLGVMIVLGY